MSTSEEFRKKTKICVAVELKRSKSLSKRGVDKLRDET
jgi:hypothetical protein